MILETALIFSVGLGTISNITVEKTDSEYQISLVTGTVPAIHPEITVIDGGKMIFHKKWKETATSIFTCHQRVIIIAPFVKEGE